MFKLKLVTPYKQLVDGDEIEEVYVPAHRGELNILPGHVPLVTTLSTGVLRYRLKGSNELKAVAMSWGYCEVNPFGVHILAETAEVPADIDLDRAQKAMDAAQSKLMSMDLDVALIEKYQNKLERAKARVDASKFH